MVKKQYLAPQAILIHYDGADIVTASGTLEADGVTTKFSSFNVSWLASGDE